MNNVKNNNIEFEFILLIFVGKMTNTPCLEFSNPDQISYQLLFFLQTFLPRIRELMKPTFNANSLKYILRLNSH